MQNLLIEKTIEINSPVAKVWRVFTDPVLTRQMGGEYVSDWKVGSSLRWKGPGGKLLTNGTILKVELEKLLQHNLLDAAGNVTSIITYEFHNANGNTMLRAQEAFTNAQTNEAFAEASEGWDAALEGVKAAAEKK